MTVYVLDHFYLVITLLITIGYQLSGFFVAWVLQFDKITGENFVYLQSFFSDITISHAQTLLEVRFVHRFRAATWF